MNAPDRGAKRLAACALLAAAVIAVYWPVLGHDFVAWDDGRYVTENPSVQEGLTARSFTWAWTAFHAANWHPLTWLSHMADWQLFGDVAAGHHATSLLLHLLNTLLLFLVLEGLSGSALRSAVVALLFGIHPLHVESVAWVAERKDVLSTLFWLLTIGAYAAWVRKPHPARYAWVVLALAAGLSAKPMLVSAPLLLLLIDYWPLGRFSEGSPFWPTFLRLAREKIPLFVLSAASCAITLAAQAGGHALASLEVYPFWVRAANAVVAYATYLWKTIWPTGLAVHYPHPREALPAWQLALSLAVLIAISLLVVRQRRLRPFLVVGWSWYLVTLLPVIGLVQVGRQALADRYTYFPLVGLFVMVAWGIPATLAGSRTPAATGTAVRSGTGLLALAFVATPLLMVVTWFQVDTWRDTQTLFNRALAVTENNAVAHNGLGLDLFRQGRLDEALPHLERAIEINPRMAEAHNNLGGALEARGFRTIAVDSYREALRVNPHYVEARNNLGVALALGGDLEQAIEQFREALARRPDYAKAHVNLAAALHGRGDHAEALREIERARELGLEPPAALVERVRTATGR